MIDSDHVNADTYLTAFNRVNDPSYDGGCDGTKMWTFIITDKGSPTQREFIADKWETCFTAKNYPISFNRLSLYIARLTVTGTLAPGNTARLTMTAMGLDSGANHIDIHNNAGVYTYTVVKAAPSSSLSILSVYPENGTTSSVLEPIFIQFDRDVPGAGLKSNYFLADAGGGLTLNDPTYTTSFMSDSAYFGTAARYLRKRIDNLLAAPTVLSVVPAQGYIAGLPNSRIDIVLSRPVGTLVAGDTPLDVSEITKTSNYALPGAAGLTLSRVHYDNFGLRSNIENVGFIENMISLEFSGTLEEGALQVRVNPDSNIKFPDDTVLAPFTLSYTVDLIKPKIATVTVPAAGTYGVGANLDFIVHFSERINVTGADSTLGLNIGDAVQQPVTNPAAGITYRYTVKAGDSGAVLVNSSAIHMGTTTIKDASGKEADVNLNEVQSTAGVNADTTARIVRVDVPAARTYLHGESLDFTVHFGNEVNIEGNGANEVRFIIGTSTKAAIQQPVTNPAAGITYRYTVQTGDQGPVTVPAGLLYLNNKTVKDTAGYDADITLRGIGSTAGVSVDTIVRVTGVDVPAARAYGVNEHLDFTVKFNNTIVVTGADSALGLQNIGSAVQQSVNDTSITYRYTVKEGDSGGVVLMSDIVRNHATLKDAAGNDVGVTLHNIGSLAGVNIITPARYKAQKIACFNNAGFVMSFEIHYVNPDNTSGSCCKTDNFPINSHMVRDLATDAPEIKEGALVRAKVYASGGYDVSGNRWVIYKKNNQAATYDVKGTTTDYTVILNETRGNHAPVHKIKIHNRAPFDMRFWIEYNGNTSKQESKRCCVYQSDELDIAGCTVKDCTIPVGSQVRPKATAIATAYDDKHGATIIYEPNGDVAVYEVTYIDGLIGKWRVNLIS
ncbi:MAG: hypothetical protein EPN93_11955 [Spirochaetes bacterium]|nr:MAG: hypothetical protein EPN93_11955 [Spirochaetota bacterium]